MPQNDASLMIEYAAEAGGYAMLGHSPAPRHSFDLFHGTPGIATAQVYKRYASSRT